MKQFQNILYLNKPTVDQGSAVARAVSPAESNPAGLTIADIIPAVYEIWKRRELEFKMRS